MSEQTLQFNDRWTALAFVAGIVALALVGVAGGALFRDSCDELFTVGQRTTFVEPDPEAIVDAASTDALVGYGERAGLGPYRGAIPLDGPVEIVGTEDGFLLFGESGVDAFEPGLAAVNASRGYEGLRRLVALNGAAIAATGDAPYEVAVLDEDLALIGCGEIATEMGPIAIDRARAFHAEGDTLVATGLDGAQDWTRTFESGRVGDVRLLIGAALVSTERAVHLVDVASGVDVAPPWAVPGPGRGAARILDVDASQALVESTSGLTVLDLRGGGAASAPGSASAGAALLAGQVVAGDRLPALPQGLLIDDVITSGATYTILRVWRVGDEVAFGLVYGPTEPFAGPDAG